MEKITDKIAALPKDGTYFSLEFFPPKTQMVLLSCDRPPSCGSSNVNAVTTRASQISKPVSNACPALSVPSS